MKNLFKKYSVILVVSLILSLLAGRVSAQLHTVKKTITKSYGDLKNEQLVLNNQYGDVVVKTWSRKEIVINIEISAQAKTINAADQLVKIVHIEASRNTDEITCKSVIGVYLRLSAVNPAAPQNKAKFIDTSSKVFLIAGMPIQGCTIRYQIYVPANLSLKISNKFGNIHMGDYAGKLDIDEKFGDFTAGNLKGPVKFNVEQGNADIAHLCNGSLDFKGFTHIRIGALSGTVDARFSSGGSIGLGLSKKLEKLNITADNVKPLSITNLKAANADLKMKGTLSNISYNGHWLAMLHLVKKTPTDSSVVAAKKDTLLKNKKKLPVMLNLSLDPSITKTWNYTIKTGTASTEINVDASFCELDVKD